MANKKGKKGGNGAAKNVQVVVYQPPKNGPKKGAGKKKNKGKRVARRGEQVPVAFGVPVRMQQNNRGNSCVVTDTEMWGEVGYTASGLQSFDFFPGATGLPRLDNQARQYELWRPRRVRVWIAPTAPTTLGGARYLAFDYDPTDSGYTIPQQIAQLNPMTATTHWQATELTADNSKVGKGKWMFTRAGGAVHPGLDSGFTAWVGSTGLTSTNSVTGTVYCEYSIEFGNPTIPNTTSKSYHLRYMASNSTTLTAGNTLPLSTPGSVIVTQNGQAGVQNGPLLTGDVIQDCSWGAPVTMTATLDATGTILTYQFVVQLNPNAKDCVWQYVLDTEAFVAGSGSTPSVASQTLTWASSPGSGFNEWIYENFPTTAYKDLVNWTEAAGGRFFQTATGYIVPLLQQGITTVFATLVTTFSSALGASGLAANRAIMQFFSPGETSANRFLPWQSQAYDQPNRATMRVAGVADAKDETARKVEMLERLLASRGFTLNGDLDSADEHWVTPMCRPSTGRS